MDDCEARKKVEEMEEAIRSFKYYITHKNDKDNNYVIEVRGILERNIYCHNYCVSKGNSDKVVMIDFDNRYKGALIVGSDLSAELNKCGYNIIAFDHQIDDHRYRVWVEKTECF